MAHSERAVALLDAQPAIQLIAPDLVLVMPQLLPLPCQHKPRHHQPISSNLPLRFSRLPLPLLPSCDGLLQQAEEPITSRYGRRQAVREALLAALVTAWLTSTVQAAPQLFTQSPAQSVQDMKALLLPGGAGQPLHYDCP